MAGAISGRVDMVLPAECHKNTEQTLYRGTTQTGTSELRARTVSGYSCALNKTTPEETTANES